MEDVVTIEAPKHIVTVVPNQEVCARATEDDVVAAAA